MLKANNQFNCCILGRKQRLFRQHAATAAAGLAGNALLSAKELTELNLRKRQRLLS